METDHGRSQGDQRRHTYLLRTYGITLQQYLDLLAEQGGGCAICTRTSQETARTLAVDHDHSTGEIRGLLCAYCNHRVVGRHRNGELLRRVADYVERHTGWFVPAKKPKKRIKNGKSNNS